MFLHCFWAMLITGTILDLRPAGPEYFVLRAHAPQVVQHAAPGQFVMLQGWGEQDPLLRRPFDFHRLDREAGAFEVLFKVKGHGTAMISRLRPGDPLSVLGPLGRPIPFHEAPKAVGLMGRGSGVSPMLTIAEEVRRRGGRSYALVSARSPDRLLCVDELRPFCQAVWTFTDDAGGGAALRQALETLVRDEALDAVFTCGSNRLASLVARLSQEGHFAGYAFMDAPMACGVGTCKGCVCRVRRDGAGYRYALACLEGPVFPLSEVLIE